MAIRLNPDGSIDFDNVEDLRAYQQSNDAPRDAVVPAAVSPEVPSAETPEPERVEVKRYLPVTNREKAALEIMRQQPNQKWTTELVGSFIMTRERPLDDVKKERASVRSAVSQMCRAQRGVVRVGDSTHYLLDEWGKHAELRVYDRPSPVWTKMKAAWEQGRDWADD